MTTAGVSNWNPSITQIITAAYQDIGAIAEDEVPTAGMYESALFKMNSFVKGLMATGIHVWTEEEAILFLQQGQYRYLLGGTTNDNCCDANGYVLAQLNSPANQGATSVVLDSTLGISSGQFFGVVLDAGPVFWTTVNGVPVGNVVTLTAPLPGGASTQNFCFAYTTKIVRPLKVPRVRLLYYQGLTEIPMTVLSRKEYENLPQKKNPGTPTQFFYTPQLVSGEFYVWPNAATSNWAARLTWYRPIMDLVNPANTMDFPQEWALCLEWNLAVLMAPTFDVPPQRFQMLQGMASTTLDVAVSWDREPEPIYFGMDLDQAQR